MSNTTARMEGVFTALVTPFKDGGIDKASFENLVNRQIAAGVSGLVPVGTTGEAATLSSEDSDWLIKKTVELAKDKNIFVLAGTGSNSSIKAAASAKRAEELGADGCLVVTPYYNKPGQDRKIL